MMNKVFHHIVLSIIGIILAILTLPIPGTAQQTINLPRPSNGQEWLLMPQILQTNSYDDERESHSEIGQISDSTPNANEWTRVVYSRYQDGNFDLYGFETLNEQEKAIPISLHPADEFHPSLDPGATSIAFVSNRSGDDEIYLINWDSTDLKRLTYNPGQDTEPVWSPDGTRLAFVSDREGNREIYTMNRDGTDVRRLTHDPLQDFSPTWSPDGTKIGWIRAINDKDGAIMIMNNNGTNQIIILERLRYIENLSWSPDGSYFAFDHDGDKNNWLEIGTIKIDGSELNLRSSGQLVDNLVGGWSSDSKNIITNLIEYVFYEGNYYITKSQIRINPLDINEISLFIWDESLGFFPSVNSRDITIPKSRVKALNRFSQAWRLPVIIEGEDAGPAKIYEYELQSRLDGEGDWTTWTPNLTAATPVTIYSGAAGETIRFRSRSRDLADHWESWPAGDGDSKTTLYTWKASGQITDLRGYPLINQTVTINPEPIANSTTDPMGTYISWLSSTGNHTLNIQRNGFMPIAPTSVEFNSDKSLNYYLSPTDNIISNGDFEDQTGNLGGWTVTGTLSAIQTSDSHTGQYAALLGLPCDQFSCIWRAESIDTGWTHSIAVDPSGTVHMLFYNDIATYPGTLYYTQLPPEGTWTPPEPLFAGDITGQSLLAIDESDTLHAIWATYEQSRNYVHYSYKYPEGSWAPPITLSEGFPRKLVIDRNGTLHLFLTWCETGIGCYTNKMKGLPWAEPIPIADGDGDLAIGTDDTITVAWTENYYLNKVIKTRTRLADGIWLPVETAVIGELNISYLTIGQDGSLHVALQPNWYQEENYLYAYRDYTGVWSEPITISNCNYAIKMAFDLNDRLHIVCGNGYYHVKNSDGSWSEPYRLDSNGDGAITLFIDRANLIHIIRSTGVPGMMTYYMYPLILTSGSVSLSQSVSIPDYPSPTLSFMVSVEGVRPKTPSYLSINVTDEVSTTRVMTIDNSIDWNLKWIDMSDWRGKSVKISFEHKGSLGVVKLDDITLGTWKTPIVEQVSPVELEYWNSVPITITGQNFLDKPRVRFNNTFATEVQRIDENKLIATLPVSLPPGYYDVWVINPEGQSNCLPKGLKLGRSIYLPTISSFSEP